MRYIYLEPNKEALIGLDNIPVKYNDMIWTEVWSDEQDVAEYAKNQHYKMLMYTNGERCTPNACHVMAFYNDKWLDVLHDSSYIDPMNPDFPKLAFIVKDFDFTMFDFSHQQRSLDTDIYGSFWVYSKRSGDMNPIFFNCTYEGIRFKAASITDIEKQKEKTKVRHNLMSIRCIYKMSDSSDRAELLERFVRDFARDYPDVIYEGNAGDELDNPLNVVKLIYHDAKKRAVMDTDWHEVYRGIIDTVEFYLFNKLGPIENWP